MDPYGRLILGRHQVIDGSDMQRASYAGVVDREAPGGRRALRFEKKHCLSSRHWGEKAMVYSGYYDLGMLGVVVILTGTAGQVELNEAAFGRPDSPY